VKKREKNSDHALEKKSRPKHFLSVSPSQTLSSLLGIESSIGERSTDGREQLAVVSSSSPGPFSQLCPSTPSHFVARGKMKAPTEGVRAQKRTIKSDQGPNNKKK
jgi:hypothetical protein